MLGWVCERAGGARMADLISALVWAPMGAEQDAEIICDGLGTAVHDGGLAATARDLLRFGQMLLDGGVVPGEDGGPVTVVPPRWLRRAWAVDAEGRTELPRVTGGGVASRAVGTGTSSGSVPASTATYSSASASTVRCCT